MRNAILIAAAGLLVAGPALADDALAKKHQCLACHSIDKIAWAMRDESPVKAVATGGRQTRTTRATFTITCSSFTNTRTMCGRSWANGRSAIA